MMQKSRDVFLRSLYLLYVFFLPMGSVFHIPEGALGTLLKSMSMNIMLIGVLYIVIEHDFRFPSSLRPFTRLFLFMFGYSIIAAIVLSITLDVQYRSPLACVMSTLVLYFEGLLSVYFNIFCLNKLVSFRDLYRVFDAQIVFSIIFGFIQLGALLGVGICASIYGSMEHIFNIVSVKGLLMMERGVTLFGMEPSSLTVYCFIIIPYILVRLFYEKKHMLFYAVSLFLFSILFVASHSTQTLLSFIAVLLSFAVISFRREIIGTLKLGAFLVGLLMAVITTMSDNTTINNTAVNADVNSHTYVIAGKVVDRSNQSTQMRSSTIINNMRIFYKYVIVGVGDGNQGFWYAENVPEWCKSSKEVNDIISFHIIPNGGGAFFPAYLAAYGLFGLFALWLFVIKYRRSYRTSILNEDKNVNTIYQIGLVLMLLCGWYTLTFRESPIGMFVLSLPLCYSLKFRKLIKTCIYRRKKGIGSLHMSQGMSIFKVQNKKTHYPNASAQKIKIYVRDKHISQGK